jgi:hypothetical protein
MRLTYGSTTAEHTSCTKMAVVVRISISAIPPVNPATSCATSIFPPFFFVFPSFFVGERGGGLDFFWGALFFRPAKKQKKLPGEAKQKKQQKQTKKKKQQTKKNQTKKKWARSSGSAGATWRSSCGSCVRCT